METSCIYISSVQGSVLSDDKGDGYWQYHPICDISMVLACLNKVIHITQEENARTLVSGGLVKTTTTAKQQLFFPGQRLSLKSRGATCVGDSR